jgi:hypothetical protein
MRLMILRMLSTNSLSAFSSAAQVRPAVAGPIQPIRAQSPTNPGGPGVAGTELGLMPFPQRPTGGRMPPRGSLLDLSV